MDASNKIKCDSCNKHQLAVRYSETSKKKYFDSLRRNQRNSKVPIFFPRCFNCSPGNRQEMKCGMCGITKDLDKFSKAARRKGDDRLCKDCQQEKDDREPDHENEVLEVEIIDQMKNDLHLGYGGSHLSSYHSATQRSQTGNTNSRRGTDTNSTADEDLWYQGNDTISLPDTQSVSSASSGITRRTTGTGWDQYAGDGRPIRGSAYSTRADNSGFVKQGAVGMTRHEKAALQVQREHRQKEEEAEQLSRDDSDDSDDDDEAPY